MAIRSPRPYCTPLSEIATAFQARNDRSLMQRQIYSSIEKALPFLAELHVGVTYFHG